MFTNLLFISFYAKIPYGGKIMEIKTRQIDDKPLTIIIEYPILDTKTKKLIVARTYLKSIKNILMEDVRC